MKFNEKYGLFVHYIGASAFYSNGEQSNDLNTIADEFDAKRFADECKEMGFEYVIFTAWHSQSKPLFPSKVMEKYRPGCSANRDLIRDILEALDEHGIKLIIYTHPRDGFEYSEEGKLSTGWGLNGTHHPNFDYFDFNKWNNFLCELYFETAERYKDKLYGFWIDEGSPEGDSYKVIDYPRLRETIKSVKNDYITIHNFYGSNYGMDFGMKEYGPGWGEFRDTTGNTWPVFEKCVGATITDQWSAIYAKEKHALKFPVDAMYRYSVMQIAANKLGGGIAWACGPYIDGGWEGGVYEGLTELYKLIKPVEKSLKNTVPSTSYPIISGTNYNDVKSFVALTSNDKTTEFIHILKPSSDKQLILPETEDGKTFTSATNLRTGKVLEMQRNDNGYIISLDEIDSLDTVIELSVNPDTKDAESCYHFINDTDTSIYYFGNWEYSRWERNCKDFENDMHISSTKGDTVVCCFEGSIIEYIGNTSPERGKCRIYIDEAYQATIEPKSEKYKPQQVLFTSRNLCGGNHTIKIVNDGDGTLEIDAFKIYK